jgi:xylan 1,4-beta-xylosidase
MPHFRCNLDKPGARLRPVWNHTVGSGEAPLALRADWREQMARTQKDLGIRYVRFHAILSDAMGTFLIESNKEVHSFFNADQIFDFLIGIGVRPFVELGFMPTALASGKTTVFSYKSNVTPPKNWRKWSALIRSLVKHWVERYGLAEVRNWYFEVWNEPNLPAFWTGSQKDYFKLYRVTVEAIKGVDGGLRVGGPATANDEWIGDFVNYCEKHKLPADFISTHHYPTDALGKPGDDTGQQLADATRGVLRERTEKTCRAAGDKPVYYTEWSSSSNPFDPRHDEPYAAAFLMKNMLDVAELVEAYSWWTFSDIFEENYFSSQPFHGGFGLQTIHGTAKPSYRAMQLLNYIGEVSLRVNGTHPTVDAWVVRDGPDAATALFTNHAFPKHELRSESVVCTLESTRKPLSLTVERVDDDHCNSRDAWKEMGSPQYPSERQLDVLQQASQLKPEPLAARAHAGGIEFKLELPPHGVAAVHLRYRSSGNRRA